ncbi:MAG: endonuclease/exonuclease/phosphatase family protein [Pseudobdellovibrio sp.]
MRIKILTYNIHKGFDTIGVRDTLRSIKTVLDEKEADICFLQEVVGQKKPIKNEIENQLEFLADKTWPYFSYGKNAVYPKGNHGNAILSLYPIIEYKNVNLTLTKYEQRGLLHAKIKINDNQDILHLLNTHINLRTSDRLEQMLIIKDYIEKEIPSKSKVILCGDLNDWNFKVDEFICNEMNMIDIHRHIKGYAARTFPSVFPFLCLDRIYYRNLKPLEIRVLDQNQWKILSDHLPIKAEFVI